MEINLIKVWQRYLFFTVVALATIYFLYLVRSVLFSFALGALLAYILFRPVRYIEKWGLKRVWAILLVYVLVLLLFVLFIYFAVPGIIREMTALAHLIPQYAGQTEEIMSKIDHMDMPYRLKEIFWKNIKEIEEFVYKGLNSFIKGIYSLLETVFLLVFAPVLAFYIMIDWEKIGDNFLKLFSPSARLEISRLFKDIDRVLISFIKGYLLVACIVGILTGIAAYFIGVKFPLLLGILAGLTNLIPFFGAFLGGVPAVLLALTDSFRLALYMALSIVIIQQVESNLITPNIIGNKLGLHPLVIVFVLLAGGNLFGIWGMLIAVPLAAVLRVIFSWFYVKIIA